MQLFLIIFGRMANIKTDQTVHSGATVSTLLAYVLLSGTLMYKIL